jgi:HD-GYP domain-containing protein (c-di-GMP phosphodiesterase class II)
MRRLNTAARSYIAALVVLAAGLLTFTVTREPNLHLGPILTFALLYFLVELFPVPLPRGGAYSVSFVIALAAIVTTGPAGATIAAAGGAAALQDTRRETVRLSRILFNASNFIISTALAGLVYTALGGPVGKSLLTSFAGALIPVAAATTVNFMTNTGLVACVLGFVSEVETSPIRIWRTQFASLSTGYYAFAFLGLLLGVLYLQISWGAVVFLLVPLLVARGAFRASVDMGAAYEATVKSLVTAIEKKDAYTRNHAERVSKLAELVARQHGLPESQVRVIRFAGLMHDVGKLGVPTRVLAKPGKLTPEEYDEMKVHPIRGHEIVGEIDFLADAVAGVRHHHERMDGGGYPDGLVGLQIPLMARLLMVCDAFDSMTSTRSYRKAKSVEDALTELRRCVGTQFDPVALSALERALAKHGWEPEPELIPAHQEWFDARAATL